MDKRIIEHSSNRFSVWSSKESSFLCVNASEIDLVNFLSEDEIDYISRQKEEVGYFDNDTKSCFTLIEMVYGKSELKRVMDMMGKRKYVELM